MWYIILMVSLAMSAVVFHVLAFARGNESWFLASILSILGFLAMLVALLANPTPEDEHGRYVKAVQEAELLKSGTPIELSADFIADIDVVNDLIARSRKWSGHWLLSKIYHSETAELEPIELSSVASVDMDEYRHIIKNTQKNKDND